MATARVPPPEFAGGLDDRIGLAGAARVPIARDGERELSRSGRGESAGPCVGRLQLARWWLSLSARGSQADARVGRRRVLVREARAS
jgi:hypothetical protein